MPEAKPADFATLYERFRTPIAKMNCGEKCAPYNQRGVPFCCDINHAIPTAYLLEWEYLSSNTNLWHVWKPDNTPKFAGLKAKTPPDQLLIECLGHSLCQRDFRSITCRAFPFFPYITYQGKFIGFSYYWEYEDRCWVISNLHIISSQYRSEFITAYEALFELMPIELDNFIYQSRVMRRVFSQRHRAIPLFHRNGSNYKISPRSGRIRRINIKNLPKYGPYGIAAKMPFPDEIVV